MHDIETRRETVFSSAKFSNTRSALLLSTKNSCYTLGQFRSSVNERSFAVKDLQDLTILQDLTVNKTNM